MKGVVWAVCPFRSRRSGAARGDSGCTAGRIRCDWRTGAHLLRRGGRSGMGLRPARHRHDDRRNGQTVRRSGGGVHPAGTESHRARSIARRSTRNIPTRRSPHGSRARRRTNTSACWDRSCARRSATRSRSCSRTTPRAPTACIRMESSTRRPRKAPCTPTMFPTIKRSGPWCRPGRRSLTSGKCRNGRGQGPTIPARSSGLYHSHVNEYKDVASGLVGPIIVARRGQTNSDGTAQRRGPRNLRALRRIQRKPELVCGTEHRRPHQRRRPEGAQQARRQDVRSAHVRRVHGQRIRRDQLQVFHQRISLRRWAGDDHEAGPACALVSLGCG